MSNHNDMELKRETVFHAFSHVKFILLFLYQKTPIVMQRGIIYRNTGTINWPPQLLSTQPHDQASHARLGVGVRQPKLQLLVCGCEEVESRVVSQDRGFLLVLQDVTWFQHLLLVGRSQDVPY